MQSLSTVFCEIKFNPEDRTKSKKQYKVNKEREKKHMYYIKLYCPISNLHRYLRSTTKRDKHRND